MCKRLGNFGVPNFDAGLGGGGGACIRDVHWVTYLGGVYTWVVLMVFYGMPNERF